MRKQAGGRENEEALRERVVSGLNSMESLLSAREGGQPKSEVGA